MLLLGEQLTAILATKDISMRNLIPTARTHLVVLLCLVSACGTDGTTAPDPSGVEPPERGFQVASPDVTIKPGEEVTYCYYFRTPNTETLVIKK